jgi:hypothetical protein
MASLISAAEYAIITGVLSDVFDSRSRQIIVYKEPIKIAANPPSNELVFGFGESQQSDAFTYAEVTGVYQAVIKYKSIDAGEIEDNSEIMARISEDKISIKVRKECRDFINNGKTEKIVCDDKTYFLDGEESKISNEFYFFSLIATK